MIQYAAAGGMAAFSMFAEANKQKKAAEQADQARLLEIAGAQSAYKSQEVATNLMKAVNREQTDNAINEALRAGASKEREVEAEIEKVTSKSLAASEGLTSGRSQGRAMAALQIEGNKALAKTESETTSMINSLVDAKDKAENDMNVQLWNAWEDMATVLTTPSNVYEGNSMDILSAGLGGASTGLSLGSALGGAATPATVAPVQGPVRSDGYL